MPKAYSYIRFSSKIQEQGDSLRRQKQLAVDYCKTHGLELVTSYEDLGLSAYKSDNSKTGALSVFLNLVGKAGGIPVGSWLLVESLDRLSRDVVDEAILLFLRIKSAGITIVSLQDGKVYGAGTNDASTMDMMMAMLVFMRANNESETKSKRVKAAWENKRKEGKRLTKICPSWLKWDDASESFIIVDKEAEVIKLIFQLASDGDGTVVIAKYLNDNNIKTTTGKTWSAPMVMQRLRAKAVIGWHAPQDSIHPPIIGYYPPIISEEVFYKVEQLISVREAISVSGRKTKDGINTLFVRKMSCALCGGVVRAVSRSSGKAYWRCTTAYQSSTGCKAQSLCQVEGERAILAALFVSIGYAEYYSVGYNNNEALRLQIIDLEQKQKDLSIDLLKMKDRTIAIGLINDLTAQIEVLRDELNRHPVTSIDESYKRAKAAYMSYIALNSIREGSRSKESVETILRLNNVSFDDDINLYRKRLQSELTQLIDSIVVSGYDEEDENGWYRMVTLTGPILKYGGIIDRGLDIRVDLYAEGLQKWLRRDRRDKRQQRQQVAQPTPNKTLEEKLLEGAKEVENMPKYERESDEWIEWMSKQKKQ